MTFQSFERFDQFKWITEVDKFLILGYFKYQLDPFHLFKLN